MITIKDDNVLIPVSLWNDPKNDMYFNELIEALEDSQELIEAIQESNEMIDLREYDLERRLKIN